MRTQIVIIGGGPAGLLLSQTLHRSGIDSVVLERASRAHVLSRIRAGMLEWGSVQMLREAGVAQRMDRDGEVHDGSAVAWAGRGRFLIDVRKYAGRPMMMYGQTQLTEDLYAARDAMGGVVIDEAQDVTPHAIDGQRPCVTYRKHDREHRIDCDFIAGCDGFHGVSRQSIPPAALRVFEKGYPFGWLGIMSRTPPLPQPTYCHHERGFALVSKRKAMLSRHYIQVDLDTDLADWPDERFWDELKARLPADYAQQLVTGPSIEKSIAPLRSFVVEPMRYGRLFLVGDAAHIVPPTGAKGLNLAISDVHYLARGLAAFYKENDSSHLDRYSETALRRVWAASRFSWWLTGLLHRFPGQTAFDLRAQEAELDFIMSSESAMRAMCEQYAGLPFEQGGG